MSLIDWEAVVLDLEAYIAAKHSHGQRELLARLAELRVQHRQIEGLPEKALRLYGTDLIDAVTPRPAGPDSDGGGAMDEASTIRRESTTPGGTRNGGTRRNSKAVHHTGQR